MTKINFIERNHYSFLGILFAILYLFGYLFIEYDTKTRVNSHLVNVLETTSIEYKLIYNIYKKNSKLIFKEVVNRPEVIKIIEEINYTNKDTQRKKLFDIMKDGYELAKKLGIKQLHYHLKNSESFLRMHKPEKYGDNLSEFRYSVKYVNEHDKRISGFEQGRIIHGFRFVYPLRSSHKKHIGSVEVSINSDAFKEMFENTLFIDAYFLLDKKISISKLFNDEVYSHYQDSIESDNYLQTKATTDDSKLKKYLKNHLKKYRTTLAPKLKEKKAFAMVIDDKGDYHIRSFIPIRNIKEKKVVAYFVATLPSEYLTNTYRDAFILKIILIFLLLAIIYAINKNLTYSQTLRREIRRKTDELEKSQQKIIEIKKMASLSTLVAGIAHEINTPVGLGITALSHFMEKTKTLKKDYETEVMDEEEFKNYLDKADSTLNLIFSNLVRAANLIKDFKEISIDENQEEKRVINVKYDFEHIIAGFDMQLKKESVEVELSVADNLEIYSYHDAMIQIITKLIANSLIHAFKDVKDSKIIINVQKSLKQTVIYYQDNGIGMNQEQVDNIYEPFYTTNRGSGGSGLGMHIVFNLVTQRLGGTIELESKIGEGVIYEIILPN